ncbi:MAG TPA: hypothetical protein VLH40_02745 [Atribacteraceae bacterium]|nr:hypothetical protein [Atribacteraceae bacterium]
MQQFDRLYRKAFFKKLTGALNKHQNRLIPFREIKEVIGVGGEHHAGNRTVEIDQIVGSENRFEDFDRTFLPLKKSGRSKWVRVNQLRMRSEGFPLVSLYQVGPYFFIRDGHHRISAAKHAGQRFIDAEVIELKLPEDTDTASTKSPEEYFLHLEEKMFQRKTGLTDIRLTIPGGYLEILRLIKSFQCSDSLNHKSTHETCPGAMPWEQAVQEWYRSCFQQALSVILTSGVMSRFKNRTPADLYLWTLYNVEALRKAACFVPDHKELNLPKRRPDSLFGSPA